MEGSALPVKNAIKFEITPVGLRPPTPPPECCTSPCSTCSIALQELLQIDSVNLCLSDYLRMRNPLRRTKGARVLHHDCIDSLKRSVKHGCPLCSEILNKWQKSPPQSTSYRAWFSPVLEHFDTRIAPVEFGFRFFDVETEYDLICTFKVEYVAGDLPTTAGREVHDYLDADLIRGWMSSCDEHHPHCQKTDPEIRPTRLIKILPSRTSTPELRLVDGADGSGDYVALSHRWGKAPHPPSMKTTKATLAAHKDRIIFSNLPHSFQHALLTARKLGFDYLWIDSLCIVQDCAYDNRREVENMDKVYRNARLTIVPADVCSPNDGFLQEYDGISSPLRKSTRTSSDVSDTYTSQGTNAFDFEFTIPFTTPTARVRIAPATRLWGSGFPGKEHKPRPSGYWLTRTFEASSIDQRAWTLQERLLSTKVLRIRNGAIGLECDSARFYEDLRYPVTTSNTSRDISGRLPKHALMVDDESDSIWGDLVHQYSHLGMERGDDRLNALNGICKFLAKKTGKRYFAGIREIFLARDLAWSYPRYPQSKVFSKDPTSPLPSWSWASCPVPLDPSQTKTTFVPYVHLDREAQDAHNIEEHASDENTRKLFLKGYYRTLDRSCMKPNHANPRFEPDHPSKISLSYEPDTSQFISIKLDITLDTTECDKNDPLGHLQPGDEVLFLLLGKDDQMHGSTPDPCHYYELLLQRVPGESNTFKRIGLIENFAAKLDVSTLECRLGLEWLCKYGVRPLCLV